MRKLLFCVIILFILFSSTSVCYAGSIPEDLLFVDESQVYFGEIKNVDGESITVIQRQNIKGPFAKDSEATYDGFTFLDSPKLGEQYLCGYLNDHNPLYLWEVTDFDTKALKIERSGVIDAMSQRMQEYLNDGKFEEKEKERLLKIARASERDAEIETTVQIEIIDNPSPAQADAADEDKGSIHVFVWIFCGAILIGAAVYLHKNRSK